MKRLVVSYFGLYLRTSVNKGKQRRLIAAKPRLPRSQPRPAAASLRPVALQNDLRTVVFPFLIAFYLPYYPYQLFRLSKVLRDVLRTL